MGTLYNNQNNNNSFSANTYGINVIVVPEFYLEGSNKDLNIYIWFYNVKIENFTNSIIQVIGRHWQIYDSNGKYDEIKGIGVVGQQPIIRPNEIFEYTSQVRLFTGSGIMQGEYYILDTITEKQFAITIPPFSLDCTPEPENIN